MIRIFSYVSRMMATLILKSRTNPMQVAQGDGIMNTITVIAPYKYEGMWVFDDPAVGLRREAFISGMHKMIDRLVASIPPRGPGDSPALLVHAVPRIHRKTGVAARGTWRKLVFLPSVGH